MSFHQLWAAVMYWTLAGMPSGSLISYATAKKLGYLSCAAASHLPPSVGNGDGEQLSGCGVGSLPTEPPGISNTICALGNVWASVCRWQSACDEMSQSFIT